MVRRLHWPWSTPAKELLTRFVKVTKRVRRPHAVAGALALSAHGYTRQTSDVDVFIKHEDLKRWLDEAREEGFKPRYIGPGHYALFLPKYKDPELRIDLMMPYDDPERDAIGHAHQKSIRGVRARVMDADYLAAVKAASDRPKDENDVLEMMDRGLVHITRVFDILAASWPEKAEGFARLVERWNASRQSARDPFRPPQRKST